MDTLDETGMLEAKPAYTPLVTSVKLELDYGEPLYNQSK